MNDRHSNSQSKLSENEGYKNLIKRSNRIKNNPLVPGKNCRSTREWKAKIRQVCLERARRKRDEAIRSRRNLSSIQNNSSSSTPALDCDKKMPVRISSSSDMTDSIDTSTLPFSSSASSHLHTCSPFDKGIATAVAMDLVREELHLTGKEENKTNMFSTNINGEMTDNDPWCMNEKDILDLIRDVEEELMKEEAFYKEGVDTFEEETKLEEALFAMQIADYDSMSNDTSYDEQGEEGTMYCPICNFGKVICKMDTTKKRNVLICSNNFMPETLSKHLYPTKNSCNFQLSWRNIKEPSLYKIIYLKGMIRNIYDKHEINGCKGIIKFIMGEVEAEGSSLRNLVAKCLTCDKLEIVNFN